METIRVLEKYEDALALKFSEYLLKYFRAENNAVLLDISFTLRTAKENEVKSPDQIQKGMKIW